jgi:hypothetical protein
MQQNDRSPAERKEFSRTKGVQQNERSAAERKECSRTIGNSAERSECRRTIGIQQDGQKRAPGRLALRPRRVATGRAPLHASEPFICSAIARELVRIVVSYRWSSRSSTVAKRSAPVDCVGAHTATAVRSPHDPQRMMSVVESCDEPMIWVRLLPQRGHSEEPVSWR